MALSPPVIFSALQQNRVVGIFPLLGQNYDRLALGLAEGVATWAIGQVQNLALTGAVVGTTGFGVVNPVATRLLVPPSIPVMVGALTGAGMVGPAASSLGSAVATGISQAFTTLGQFTGPVAGVGVGVSTAKVTVANPATLAAILAPLIGTGPAGLQLVAGLSNGIASILLLGTGVGSVIGAPSVFPATTLAIHAVV